MSNMSYVPGDAHAVVTPEVTVLVRAADQDLLTRLWQTASATPDVMALLEVLGEAGFAAMPEFAATVRAGGDLRVVTRGTGTVAVVVDGNTTTCDATGVSTWSEQRFPAERVSVLTVALGTPTGTVALPVVAGVVPAATVTTGDGPAPAVEMPAVEIAPVEVVPVEVAPPAPEPEPTPEPEPQPEPEPEDRDEETAAPEVEDSAQTMVEPDEASFDALFGATVAGRRPEDAAIREPEEFAEHEPAAVVPPPPLTPGDSPAQAPEQGAAEGDHDQHTMTPEEFARLRSSARGTGAVTPPPPVPPAAPAAPTAPAGPRVVLTLSTGREIVMDRPVLVGRAPRARNTSSTQLPLLVVVDDPYVSGTHLELAVVGDQLQATDVSSNGTVLRHGAGGPPSQLTRNESTSVSDGSVLVISEDLTITVAVGAAGR